MSFNGTHRYRPSAQPWAGFGAGLRKSDHPTSRELADSVGERTHTDMRQLEAHSRHKRSEGLWT